MKTAINRLKKEKYLQNLLAAFNSGRVTTPQSGMNGIRLGGPSAGKSGQPLWIGGVNVRSGR